MKYLKLFVLVLTSIVFSIFDVYSTEQPQKGIDFATYLNAKTNDQKIVVFYDEFIYKSGAENIDSDTLLFFIKDIYSVGVQEKNLLPISYAAFVYGRFFYNKQQYNEAEQWLQYTINVLDGRDQDSLMIEPVSLLGNIYYFKGELSNAKKLHEKALEHGKIISEKTGDLKFEMFAQLNLSKIELAYGHNDKVIKQALEAVDFFSERRALPRLSNAYGIIGEAYMAKNEHQAAIENFIKATEYSLAIDDFLFIANAYTNLGIAEFYSGNFERTGEYFKLALNYRIKDGSIYKIAEAYYNLADYYTTLEEPQYVDSAFSNYYKTIEYAEKGNFLGLKKEALHQIASVYETIGQKDLQEEVLQKMIELQEAISKSEIESRNASAEIGFKQNDIEMIDTSDFEANRLDENQSALINPKTSRVIFVANLIVLLLVVFYIYRRKKRKKNI